VQHAHAYVLPNSPCSLDRDLSSQRRSRQNAATRFTTRASLGIGAVCVTNRPGLVRSFPGNPLTVSSLVHVVLLLALLVFYFGQAYFAGRVADRKGRSFSLYVVAALIVGPLVLIVALVLPRSRRLA
jgi:MFS family permease